MDDTSQANGNAHVTIRIPESCKKLLMLNAALSKKRKRTEAGSHSIHPRPKRMKLASMGSTTKKKPVKSSDKTDSQEASEKENPPTPPKPIKLIDIGDGIDEMAVFRKFFDQELWEFKCSKADCNCNNQPMPAERCDKCSHATKYHLPIRKFVKSPTDGMIDAINRLFILVKCARASIYIYKQERWVKHILGDITTEAQEVHRHTINRNVSNQLKTLLDSLKVNTNALNAIPLPTPKGEKRDIDAATTRVKILVALDSIYYAMYYYSICRTTAPKKIAVDKPVDYFGYFAKCSNAQVNALNNFIAQQLDEKTRDIIDNVWHFFDEDQEKLPDLLRIHNMKWAETVELFHASRLISNGEMDRVFKASFKYYKPSDDPKKLKSKKEKQNSKYVTIEEMEEPLCDALLQSWRDCCRDWPSMIYSYAIPTPEALALIAKYAPIIEAGAGTGYWAYLLQQAGASVDCFDSSPPSVQDTQNEFHANTPTFVDIEQADVVRLASVVNKTLFLCYPPPEDTMAVNALQYYTGEFLIYVGEWGGFTATSDFEMKLLREYRVVERLDMPNWPDSACLLSVWQRRPTIPTPEAPPQQIQLLSCTNCGVPGLAPRGLRRCRLCRMAFYCSDVCADQNIKHHRKLHALNMIFLKGKPNFLNPNHFKKLRYVPPS